MPTKNALRQQRKRARQKQQIRDRSQSVRVGRKQPQKPVWKDGPVTATPEEIASIVPEGVTITSIAIKDLGYVSELDDHDQIQRDFIEKGVAYTENGRRVDPDSVQPFASVAEMHDSKIDTGAIMPAVEYSHVAMTEQEWDAIKFEASCKKKSFRKVAEAAGWTLVDDGEPKIHGDWIRERS